MARTLPAGLESDVTLAPLTTLELGGAARHLVEVEKVDQAVEAVRWARARGEPVAVLGGGSNVVVADSGFAGLILRPAFRGWSFAVDGPDVLLTAGAGCDWDEVVAAAVEDDLAGIECLAGIPGSVGATPIQNVGAYGQEVSKVVEKVEAIDLESLEICSFSPEACRFGYRTSIFRRAPGRYLVTRVVFRLVAHGPPTLTYRELQHVFEASRAAPALSEVREAVLDLRRSKSMVLDPDDPNHRSAGSFFVNPVLAPAELRDSVERAREAGILGTDETIPGYPVDEGLVKVPAAWLIEKAGFAKGMRRGAVGLSSAHALALVHHGGGTSSELVELAREIRDGVWRLFGVKLKPEPMFLGFASGNPLDEQGSRGQGENGRSFP